MLTGLAGPVAASSTVRLSLLRLGAERSLGSLCAGADSTKGTNPQHAT